MFQRVGKVAFKKDLSNTVAFCEHLGNPHRGFPSIHIAGTNGKGSVSSMLAAVMNAAGYKTGLYTSPHLKSFTERIRIDGVPVTEEFVATFVTEQQDYIEQLNPSYFETTVAMAFDYFAKEHVDIAIIETGLGGRLDSTNIISPLLSIITNIGWDHMDLLGDTLGKIAFEKAGIIKANTPVIIGVTHQETAPVFLERAKAANAPIQFADVTKGLLKKQYADWDGQTFLYKKNTKIDLDLSGVYQEENLNTALVALDQLASLEWHIPKRAIQDGLKEVRKRSGLRGRMEVLQNQPLILCDTAHNVDGLKMVMTQLLQSNRNPMGIVLGMVSDKDHQAILSLLPKHATYFFTRPDVPRGLDAKLLQQKALAFDLEGTVFPTVEAAYQALKSWLPEHGIGFVGGSTFTVAEVV